MIQLLNDALMPLVNDGLITVERMHDLIYIKEFIDRVASKKYLEERDVDELQKRYGVLPNIISWGDYFQTEMASSLIELDEESFQKAVSTVKFDIMSACEIFSGREAEFFAWVDDAYYEVTSEDRALYTEEEEEIIHLKIMKDYFFDLGIVNNFSPAEIKWYQKFNEALAI